MRSQTARIRPAKAGALDGGRAPRMWRGLKWSSRDAMAFVVGAGVTIAILVNVLFLQSGSHPAPMFKSAAVPAKPVVVMDSPPVPVSRPHAVETAATPNQVPAKPAAPPTPRMPGEIIIDIQRELARRGYYDGAVDGLYGPKTDSAIRDFEQAAALKPSAEPNEALLQAITRASGKLVKGTTGATAAARLAPGRNDAPDRPSPSKRVIALQRALADYGYGQIRPSGVLDGETQAAIEKFERERRLPITGQASDRVVRELAAMTGRPLE